MIETVFALFALAWMPWALSAILIVGAVVIWSHLRRRLQPVLAGLEEALAIVEDAPTPAAFRNRFPSINEPLAGNPIIGEAWRSFAQTLVPVPGRDKLLGATRRPADDLNEAILASAGVNLGSTRRSPTTWSGSGCCSPFSAWWQRSTSPAPGSLRPMSRRPRERCATSWPRPRSWRGSTSASPSA